MSSKIFLLDIVRQKIKKHLCQTMSSKIISAGQCLAEVRKSLPDNVQQFFFFFSAGQCPAKLFSARQCPANVQQIF